MTATHLARRSLRFYWRSHLPILLGAALTTAVLTGALLVGDSMRGSLRHQALERLGAIDQALVSPSFFSEGLANDVATAIGNTAQVCPLIITSAGARNTQTGARIAKVTIIGTDNRFSAMAADDEQFSLVFPNEDSIIINESLADQVQASPGTELILTLGKHQEISTQTLLGNRQDTLASMRLTVSTVIPNAGLGRFSINPGEHQTANGWIPIRTLQKKLKTPSRVNTILVRARGHTQPPKASLWNNALKASLALEDLGLTLSSDTANGYISLESSSLLVNSRIEESAIDIARQKGMKVSPILTYLANTISFPKNATERVVPYSTVAGLDISDDSPIRLQLNTTQPATTIAPGEILLNQWTADRLNASAGDSLKLTFYQVKQFGNLTTEAADFTVAGIVTMNAAAVDRGFTPVYPGVTDARRLSDWDPPFPVDFSLIGQPDEDYWTEYNTAPKAFISLTDARRLWSADAEHLGQSTSIRITPDDKTPLPDAARAIEKAILSRIDPADFGLRFEQIRDRFEKASRGSTDFGMLFIGFSFFLIIAALLMVHLLFSLSMERRASQIGLLSATGIQRRTIMQLLLTEGTAISFLGTALGLLLASAYALLMLTGLRSWWSTSANAPYLTLYVSPVTIVTGLLAGILATFFSMIVAIRRLCQLPPRLLLTGNTELTPTQTTSRGPLRTTLIALAAVFAAILTATIPDKTNALQQSLVFFASGTLLLVACICGFSIWLQNSSKSTVTNRSGLHMLRLGIRNVSRNQWRSLLLAGLMAGATFVIVAIQSMHLSMNSDTNDRHGPTGGFALVAESANPILYDLDDPDGRADLAITDGRLAMWTDARVYSFMLKPGENNSCSNLYTPSKPRVIGVDQPMINRGGFTFTASADVDQSTKTNRWLLLNQTFDDGAIPAIADESVVLWQYHLRLGQDLLIQDDAGQSRHLRIVAMLAGSALADELIISQPNFKSLFPSVEGYSFFLIETPPKNSEPLASAMENDLSAYGLDVTKTTDRLAAYLTVQNTYLSTFQTLGGLGLALGTCGLSVVLLRNCWERRGELALMRTLGFSHNELGLMVLAENSFIVMIGLLAGLIPATLAVLPQIMDRASGVPWANLVLTILAVLAAALLSGVLATITALRTPLLTAIRAE